jgi:transcriptional regulator with XRE-family HTH domain
MRYRLVRSRAVSPLAELRDTGDRAEVMDRQDDRQTLGDAIKTRRRELGWSQEELAQRMIDHGDVTFRQSDVSRLERGKVVLPHRERLEHMAAVLGLSLGELLARSGWSGWRDWSNEAIVSADADEPGGAPVVVLETRAPAGWTALNEPSQGNARLREALDQARRTVAHSEQVLKQAEALQAIYEQPLSGRHPRTMTARTGE